MAEVAETSPCARRDSRRRAGRSLRRSAVALLAKVVAVPLLVAPPAMAAQAQPALEISPLPSAQAPAEGGPGGAPGGAVSAAAPAGQPVAEPGQAQPQAPAQGGEGSDDSPATVTVTEVEPPVPGEGGALTLRGTITNNGDSAIVDSSVAPRRAMPLDGRDAVAEALSRTGFDLHADGGILNDHARELDTIAPGMSRTFTLSVPVSDLDLGEDGVYQLAVTLTGQTEEVGWDDILGVGRTVLPWQAGAEAQTELSVMWPLVSGTHLTSQSGSDEEQTPTLRDHSLLEEISPGGRLHQLVTLGAELPVTWVIDPDLLASVDAMTEEYQVATDDGTVAGGGQEEARAWLGDLKDAVADAEVVALPFADPDLASLAHQGRDVPGALGHLKTATEVSESTVETVLGVRPSTDFAWPVEGAVDAEIASVATSAGASHIIARSDSLVSENQPHTPTAARPVGGGTTALVADAALSRLFEGDMASTGRSTRAQQELLGQTLAITQEAPATERSLVLAPQRTPTADQAQAMADAVALLEEEADWVRLTDLTEAAEAQPDAHANQQLPSVADYPQHLREQELPTSAFQSMRETQRTVEDFQPILTRPDRVVPLFGNAIRREMSTSWRGAPASAAEYRSSVQSDLEALTERVHLIQKSRITLSGRSATIPVTVQNSLVQDVQGLELRLTSSRRLGLEVSEAQELTVNGGHSQSVKFSTTARANGRTFLEAQLYTLDGKPYGEPMRFQADVTSITSAVMMVIAGGLLLVVLAGVRMYTQRKRAASVATAGGPAGESETDTSADGPDSPAQGERLDRDE